MKKRYLSPFEEKEDEKFPNLIEGKQKKLVSLSPQELMERRN